MPRRSEPEALRKITLNLFDADVTKLQMFYDKTGYSRAIRYLIRQHVQHLEQQISEKIDTPLVEELDLDLPPAE